jgi:hypothetical protein
MADTKPIDTNAISKATARSWDDWLAWLSGIGAEKLSHAEIARRIVATGDASSWWAQSITVAWEQHIGRRKPGQRAGGAFEVSVTRTVPGEIAALFEKIAAHLDGVDSFDGVARVGEPRTSVTPKRSYWRGKLADGSGVQVSLEQKAEEKVLVTVAHDKLAAEDDIPRWHKFWKEELGKV